MTTKAQLREQIAWLKHDLAEANLAKNRRAEEKRHEDTLNINKGLIPVELLLQPQFIENSRGASAQVTVTDARVLSRLRQAVRHAKPSSLFDNIVAGTITADRILPKVGPFTFGDLGDIGVNVGGRISVDTTRLADGVIGSITPRVGAAL